MNTTENEKIFVTDWHEWDAENNPTGIIANRVHFKKTEFGIFQRHEFKLDHGVIQVEEWIPSGATIPANAVEQVDLFCPAEFENFYRRIERVGRNTPVEVTEDEFWEALEVLPPIYIKGASWFAVSEPHSHTYVTGHAVPVFHCFAQIKDKYFGCVGTVPEAREAFNKIQNKDVLMEGTVKEFEAAAESGQMLSLGGLAKAIQSEGGRA